MKPLEKVLKTIDGYLLTIKRNTETGMYEIEVGIPKDWEYLESDDIDYEVLGESELGAILRIFAKSEDLVIDDLINYVNLIIETNFEIARMQKEFEDEIQKKKEQLKSEILSFQEKLDMKRKINLKEMSKSKKKKVTVDEKEEEEIVEETKSEQEEENEEYLKEKLS